MNVSSEAVGLDFGTSTTLVAASGEAVPIGRTRPWMTSLVGFDDRILIGEAASDLPDRQIIRSIKRFITDERFEFRVETPAGLRNVSVDDAIVELLREVVRLAAQKNLVLDGQTKLRLGCPAMWNRRQRTRLVTLAERAGLPVTFASLVDEPVAAGIAWLNNRAAGHDDPTVPKRVLVFDMGGGTLDIAVLDVRGTNHRDVSVLAAVGLAQAGDSLDEAIAVDLERLLALQDVVVDHLADPDLARDHLVDVAREAKIALSNELEFPVSLSRRIFGIPTLWYRREQLEAVFDDQLGRAEQYVAAALRTARLAESVSGSAHDIVRTPLSKLTEGVDHVVLSGGMSHIPLVAQRMKALFPATTTVELAADPPENAVVLGLADPVRHGRINMFRPAFDIYVSWDGGDEQRSVYEAFTPIYEPWQVAQGGNDLCYKRNGLDLSLPRKATGKLRVVSLSGERAKVTLGGRNMDGFPVELSEQKFEFILYCNGRIRLTDGGGVFDGQVEDWYQMHGHDHGDRLRAHRS